MPGSAYTVSNMQDKSSASTATASTLFSCGATRPPGAQKCRMPALDSEMVAASPETSSSANSSHPVSDARPCKLDSAARSENFATNPERGGKPATSSAHVKKVSPSSAIDTGNVRPTSGSSSSSR